MWLIEYRYEISPTIHRRQYNTEEAFRFIARLMDASQYPNAIAELKVTPA